MFGSGTACVVCPIKEIVYQGERHQIPTMEEGAPVTTMFYKQLTDIQVGIIIIMNLLCIYCAAYFRFKNLLRGAKNNYE